jgi:hypothetical protein
MWDEDAMGYESEKTEKWCSRKSLQILESPDADQIQLLHTIASEERFGGYFSLVVVPHWHGMY